MQHNSPEKISNVLINRGADQPEAQPTGEADKRDDLHEAIKFYLGGRLALAPLEGYSPRSILEMGSGSGAWAIQAAEQFPEADVLAIDLSPLPSKPLPSNLRFQTIDMTKPFPFGPQTFDIVHSRFVFRHVPGFEEVLNRTMQLVKPGGWLLLEEVEVVSRETELDPGQDAFWVQFQQLMNTPNPRAGSAIQGIIETSGLFSEANVRKIVLPISKCEEAEIDIGVRRITESYRRVLSRTLLALKEKVAMSHFKPEVIAAAEEEIYDPTSDMKMEIYMTWSRKRDSK